MDATPEPMIRLDGVSKMYADGTVAVHDLDLDVPEGELVVLVGPSGCGKSTTLKMINRLIEPTSGRILLDGEDVTARRPGQAAPPDRLRHPADRAVPAPDRRRQRRHGPAAARLGPQEGRRPGPRAARAGRPRPGPLRQALPAPALRRSAAAGRRRPGAGRRPAGAADGRAVRRGRPDRARAAAGGVPPAAARGAQDRAVRHPRHRRGGPAGRPDRGVLRGRPPRAVRRARQAPRVAGHRLRRELRRRRPRPQAALGDRHRRSPTSSTRRSCTSTDRVADATASLRAAGARWAVVLDDEDRLHGWIVGRARPATGPSPTGRAGWRRGCRSGRT